MAITAATRQDIIELVVTALNAAPGTTLLNELVAIVDGGGTLADVAANLAASDTFTARYPAFQTAEEFADEWLGNLIPEAGVDALAEAKALVVAAVNGGTTAASLLLQAQEFLSAASETDAAFGTSAANFNNKTEVASHYTITNETAALGTATLADVTSDDATVTTVKAALDATPSDAAVAFSLTKAIDSKTTGSGDDIFSSANTATVTLSSGDILDGGAGTDTLDVSNTVASATIGTGVTTSNIEALKVNAVAATTVDTALMTGITDVYNNGSLGALTVSGLKAIPNVHLTATSADTTVNFASALTTAGTADAMTVALSAAATSGNANLTVGGIETFNVIASTASGSATKSQTLTSTTAHTVAITGDASTNITVSLPGATATQTGTFTGNDATNRTTLTVDAADVVSVDLKGGDDTLTTSSIGAKHTYTGGDGSDTLKLTQAVASAASTKATVSGWETLNISDAGTGTVDMDAFAGVTKVVYDDGLGGAATVDDAVTGVEVEVDVGATAQNLTVDLKTDGAADAITLTLDAVIAGDDIGTINASDAETLTITVDDDSLDATGTLGIASITLGDATTLNISGDAATTIAAATNPTTAVLATLNAGGMTDNISIAGMNFVNSGATVTLGSGDDSLTMGTANGADSIDISAGGKDTIVYTAVAQSDASGMDTITGFTSGSDDIDLTALGVNTTSLFGGVGATKGAAEALLAAATAPTTVFQADENILWVDSSGDNQLGAGDFRVKLSGVSTIVATDLGLSAAGATIAAEAANAVLSTALATSMTAKATNEGDSISSTSAFSVGSTFDGGLGTDTITFSRTAGGTTIIDLDDAAGDIENIENVVLGAGLTRLDLLAADLKANAAGEIASITGPATATDLRLSTGSDVSETTLSGIETITAAGDLIVDKEAVDVAITSIDLAGANATLTLHGATSAVTIDFSTTDIADGDAAGNDNLTIGVDADDSDITVILDANDLIGFDTIAGDATAGVTQTVKINDSDDISALTVTNVDNLYIGNAANSNQTITVSGADFVATNFKTVVGSGNDNITIGDAGAVDLTNTTISGIDAINFVTAAANDITLDAASISGSVDITAAGGADLLITEAGTYTNLSIAGGDFDSMVLTSHATNVYTYNVTEAIFDDDHTDATATSIVAIDGTAAAADPILAVAMAGTTLDLEGVTVGGVGATTDVDITVTGTSGNDVITVPDLTTTGSAFSIATGAGNDEVRVSVGSGNAAPTDTNSVVVIADAIRITDFDATKDTIAIDISDGVGINATVGTAVSGGINLNSTGAGFTLITNAAVSDFTNAAQVAAAVGVNTTTDNDVYFVALSNAAGSQVGVYAILDNGGNTGNAIDPAADGISLVAVLDISAGTFGLTNMGVW
jgi:hypothetical protein